MVQKLKESGAEAVLYGGYHPEASKLVKQMKDKGVKIPFISDDGVKDDTFIKVAGEFAEGVYATAPLDTSTNPLAIKAVEAHKKAYGADPGAFYLNAWAAAVAITNAIQKAGGTDNTAWWMLHLNKKVLAVPGRIDEPVASRAVPRQRPVTSNGRLMDTFSLKL